VRDRIRLRAGIRLALTTFTVLPVRAGRVDRPAAATAMALGPLVGAGLGAALAGLLAGLTALGAAPLLAAALGLGGLALATRGLHLDGLADTADGLGCHGLPERARAVMRSPAIGPFGVATLLLVLLAQAAALASLATGRRWAAVGLGVVVGRLGIAWACRRSVPPARPDGLGALVAGTLPWYLPAAWTLATGLLGYLARGWLGVVAVGLVLVLGMAGVAHTTRRFGGVTGDVLGAVSEAGTMLSWAVLALTR
jgi:adenosylcobinamide-GDP ribazoletransferase